MRVATGYREHGKESVRWRFGSLALVYLVVFFLIVGGIQICWALQRHPLTPENPSGGIQQALPSSTGMEQGHAGDQPQGVQEAVRPGGESGVAPPSQAQGHEPAGKVSQKEVAPATPHTPAEAAHGASPSKQAPAEHEGEAAGRGEHGVELPQISPIPGVTFVETMINLIEHELHGRTFGWRPNDLIIGRFTDNVNNYQLGVLEAIRFTARDLKVSLTRMGDADSYDPDLEQALNLLMNRSTLFWFPSAESSYQEAVDHLKKFQVKLQNRQRVFYYRNDNLLLLISTYKDLLGNVNRNLIRSSVSWFDTDDYFYYAKGVAHVYYEILKVIRVGFQNQLASTLYAQDIMDEILHELHRAEKTDPWIILDSALDSFFANHRANLNAPLSEVAHLLTVLSQF